MDNHHRRSGTSAGFLVLVLLALLLSLPGRVATAVELPDSRIELLEPWTGDLAGIAERRLIRVVTSFSKTGYFLDGLTQHGATYELLQAFEAFVNERLATPAALPVRVLVVPVARDRLIPALVEGRADIAAANLTATDRRRALVAFSAPLHDKAREVVVGGPAAPVLATLDDLAGTVLHARRSSSYWESVEGLNASLTARGLAPVGLVAADEYLEDEDLLEMVAAGILPYAVIDEHKAVFWADILPGLVVHRELVLRDAGEIAWAVRPEALELLALVDAFVATTRKGTMMGNILVKRYFESNKWVRNPASTEDFARFGQTAAFFQDYAGRYGFDWLMIAAQGYQESRIDQSVLSPAGAVGIMQLLPTTANDPAVGMANIHEVETNIHAGIRYLRHLTETYLDDPAIGAVDRTLMAFAAYNAGPGNLRKMRARAEEMGLDPMVWFGNVELAAASVIGRETVTYVANIAKYYYAYRLLAETEAARPETAVAE